MALNPEMLCSRRGITSRHEHALLSQPRGDTLALTSGLALTVPEYRVSGAAIGRREPISPDGAGAHAAAAATTSTGGPAAGSGSRLGTATQRLHASCRDCSPCGGRSGGLRAVGHHAHIITTKDLSFRTGARRRGAGSKPEKTDN